MILSIVYAILGVVVSLVSSIFYSILFLVISLAFIFFCYGFVALGKKYRSKLIKVASWGFIILAVLLIVFMIAAIVFPEFITSLFLGSFASVLASGSFDLSAIFSQLLASLASLLIILILVALSFAVLNIVFGIGLIKLKISYSMAAGILHIAGGILFFVLPVAFIFDTLLLMKEGNERR